MSAAKPDAVAELVRRYVLALESGEPWTSGQLAQEIRALPGLAPRLKKGFGSLHWRADGDVGNDKLGHFRTMHEAQFACEEDISLEKK